MKLAVRELVIVTEIPTLVTPIPVVILRVIVANITVTVTPGFGILITESSPPLVEIIVFLIVDKVFGILELVFVEYQNF